MPASKAKTLNPPKTTTKDKTSKLGRLFFVLCFLTLGTQLSSLQIRYAIFGGTGWLSFIKYETCFEKLGILALLACFTAAICGLWIALFHYVGKGLKVKPDTSAKVCASSWVIILAIDLIYRHKIAQVLGDAFDFFDFASGVGGVWRMLVQTFNWYGDLIILASLAILSFAIVTYALFHYLLKQNHILSKLDSLPRLIFIAITSIAVTLSFFFMTVLAPFFPDTHRLVTNETILGASFHTMLNLATDFDRDGYAYFDLPPDTAPFNAKAHPHALDIPDDGIDQDLLLGDLKTTQLTAQTVQRIQAMGQPARQSFPNRKHLILVLMESVRHDMLNAEIDGKAVMPELKKFIQNGASDFKKLYATRAFTQNTVTQSFWGGFFDPGHSLIDDFKKQGYKTAAFSGENLLDEGFDLSLGLKRAAQTIVDPRNMAENIDKRDSVPAAMLMNEIEKYLDTYDDKEALFMYVFFQDPHFPYQQDNPNVFVDRPIKRSEINATQRPRLWRTYANQVHHIDKAAGRLIKALQNKKMLDNSLVIFVSDHGESLFDDGKLLGHGIAFQDIMSQTVTILWGAQKTPDKIMTHVDLRTWIYEQLETKTNCLTKARAETSEIDPESGVFQFLGATTAPSEISWLKANGERLVYNYANATAYTQGQNFCHKDGATLKKLSPKSTDNIHTRINPQKDLDNSGIYTAPINAPLKHPEVQNLIRSWAYLQWYHRKD